MSDDKKWSARTGGFDPMAEARAEANPDDSEELGGIGITEKGHATPTLRVLSSNLGCQWLEYGGMCGGTQDFQKNPQGNAGSIRCDWFTFFYRGILTIDDRQVFGYWKVRVTGIGLEPVARKIGKHMISALCIGDANLNQQPVKVSGIEFSECKVVGQNGIPLT